MEDIDRAHALVRSYFETWIHPDAAARRMTTAEFRRGIVGIYRYVLLSEGDLETGLRRAGLVTGITPRPQVESLEALLRSHVGPSKRLGESPPLRKLFESGAGLVRHFGRYGIRPKKDWLYFGWRLSRLYLALRPLHVAVDPSEILRAVLDQSPEATSP